MAGMAQIGMGVGAGMRPIVSSMRAAAAGNVLPATIPASDSFDGIGYDAYSSNSVTGERFLARLDDEDSKAAVSGGLLTTTNDSTPGNDAIVTSLATLPAHSFYWSMDIASTSDTPVPSASSHQAGGFITFTNGHFLTFVFKQTSSDTKTLEVIVGDPGISTPFSEAATFTGDDGFVGVLTVEVVQNGSNIDILCYLDGTLKYSWLNKTLTPDSVCVNGFNGGTATWVVNYNSVTLRNGTLASPGSNITVAT